MFAPLRQHPVEALWQGLVHRRDHSLLGIPFSIARNAFAHHASVSFRDIVVASGGLSFADLYLSFCVQLRAFCAAQAACMRCRVEDVCWRLHSGPEAAPGVPLSFSVQLGSPGRPVSFLLFWLLSLLEMAFLVDEAEALHKMRIEGARPHPQVQEPSKALAVNVASSLIVLKELRHLTRVLRFLGLRVDCTLRK
jgi:hypothetical protein